MANSDLKSRTELYPAADRRDLYKILAECYYRPDDSLLESLKNLDQDRGELFTELAGLLPAEEDIPALVMDHTRLFVGPYGLLAPPYGSVFLEDKTRVMGTSTIDAQRQYAEEGLDIELKEVPDHIAIELEFMYYLVFRQIEAGLNSDPAGVERYLAKQKVFLERHLGAWVTEFTNNIASQADTGFYRSLARITQQFVSTDLD